VLSLLSAMSAGSVMSSRSVRGVMSSQRRGAGPHSGLWRPLE
jgi:hypothetical protein